MGLRAKFNLILLAVFLVGLVGSGLVSYNLLHKNARETVARNAAIMMATAIAIRSYTVAQVKPHLEAKLSETFLPQTVPAYAATETLNKLREAYPDYSYKEATLNPTNPRDRATDWEADIVRTFVNEADRKEIVTIRDTPTGQLMHVAHPIRLKNPACLTCHSVPSVAPKSMLKLYGDDNGFGWKLDDVIGAQIVSVPTSLPTAQANHAFYTFMGSLFAVFSVLFVVLNIMLDRSIIRHVNNLARATDQISKGDFEISEFHASGKDEIAHLAGSFNRMRRSLEKAMQMIES